MKGSFKFNGISTEDLGLFIQVPPSYTFPTRDVSTVNIPGRNGEVYIDNKTYKQSERVYSIAAQITPDNDLYTQAGKVIEWLNSTKGQYFKLEDSYDSKVYRMATFISSGSVTNYYDQAFAFNVTFKCKPQRFLKYGDDPIYSDSSEINIINPTGYEAKPIIDVHMSPALYTSTKVIMLDVKNQNESISNVTLSIFKDPSTVGIDSKVTIDSENMVVCDEKGTDLSSEVSTNGKDFPELRSGESIITVAKYAKIDKMFKKYQSIIDDYISENNGYVRSIFRPYDAIIKDKSTSTFIKSYEQLINNIQESYQADSVQQQAYNQAKNYTFPSFNSYLDSISEVITIGSMEASASGTVYSDFGIKATLNGSNIEIRCYNTDRFFMTKNTKVIKLYHDGDLIDTIKNTDIIDVKKYRTVTDNDNYFIDISGYTNNFKDENWLSFVLSYTDGANKQLSSINFYGIKTGYYFFPKPSGILGLFSKDKWEWKTYAEGNPIDLGHGMSWKTQKQAFTSGVLNASTTEEISVRMIENYPIYKDIETVTKDEDGNEIRKIASECHFEVTSADQNLDNITISIKTNHNGWYRYTLNDEDNPNIKWKYLSSEDDGETIIVSGLSGTSSITVLRIGEVESDNEYEKIDATHIPNYWFKESYDEKLDKKIPGWPEFLDPRIYDDNDTLITDLGSIDFSDLEHADIIHFKVLENHWYRYLEKVEDGQNYWSDWYLDQDNPMSENSFIQMNITVLNSTYIEMIKENPYTLEMPNNRAYSYTEDDSDAESTGPEWLKVDYIFNPDKPDAELGTPKTIEYKAAKCGLYKWDENTVWMKKIPAFIYDSEEDMRAETEHLDERFVYLVKTSLDDKNHQLYDKYTYDSETESFSDEPVAEDTDAMIELADALLLSTAGQENTVFYYMENRPDYPIDPNFNVHVEIEPVATDQDPKKMIFIVDEEEGGYYRVNNESNWKFYKKDAQILESEINVDNTIYYLKEEPFASDESVTITIVPRWWTL